MSEPDPIIEAHRIVAESESGVPLEERLGFLELVALRQFRQTVADVRRWWIQSDREIKQLAWMVAAVAISELLSKLIRNGG